MALFQITIADQLKKAIHKKAKSYGVPASSLVRIVLVKAFLADQEEDQKGNIFSADRDNQGRGISIDELINAL